MKRQRIVRNLQLLTQLPRRGSVRAIFDQQLKHPQAGFLRQGGQRDNGMIYIHMSRYIDILTGCQRQSTLFPRNRPPIMPPT